MSNEGHISNYPNGFLNGVTIRGVPLQETHPGEVFWVNSTTVLAKGGVGGSDGNGGTYTKPFSTLDGAVGKTKASRGDIIVLMPGFTETVSTATALALDVAGIAIVGLGGGSLRPNITLDTATTATIAVSAANISMKNVIFTANFADIADLFTPTAIDFHVEDCDFVAAGADLNFVEIADTGTTDAEVNGLSFLRCKWIEPDLSTTSFLNVDADLDSLTVEDCYFNLGVNTSDLPVVAVVATGKDLTNVRIVGNECIRLNDANPLLVTVDTTTANTGIMADNIVRHAIAASPVLLEAGTNIGLFNNETSGAADVSGSLTPTSGASAAKGLRVQRAAADIFDGTSTSLFTVSGGRVAVTTLTMEVSGAAVDATASATKFVANPTTGTSVDMCATLDVTGDELGSLYSITGVLATALAGGVAGAVADMISPVVVNAGTIDLSSAADAGTGGALVSVDIWYIALDDGATVVTA